MKCRIPILPDRADCSADRKSNEFADFLRELSPRIRARRSLNFKGDIVTYWQYWNLSGVPFAQPKELFRGTTVEEALARIDFLVTNRRNLGVLLGPSGVGKSTLLRHYTDNPLTSEDVPNLQVLRANMLGLAAGELLADLAVQLCGSRRPLDAPSAWRSLCDYFQAASREGTHSVLLIDDTECSTVAAEAELARLLAMRFPMTVVLAVESQLSSAVSPNLLERSELQIELSAWDTSQTAEFLSWTFTRLGRRESIFTAAALERIQQLSRGIPRRIIQLTDLALVSGAVAQASRIDADCIDQVAWELPKSAAA